jgi:hypothetical protein
VKVFLEKHFQWHLPPLAGSVSSFLLYGWLFAWSFGDWKLDLGRLMASSCRQKILEALSKVGQTHVMDLVRRVNSTYGQVNRNLQILEREGIVTIQYYGRLKMVKQNRESPKTVNK